MRTLSLLVVILVAMMFSCSKHEDGKAAFTLASGVSLTNVRECSEALRPGLTVQKIASDYLVTAIGGFSCDAELKEPYLTLAVDKKATLVLDSVVTKSNCECFKSVTVRLVGRLEPGDVLYVLSNNEVIGHAVLP